MYITKPSKSEYASIAQINNQALKRFLPIYSSEEKIAFLPSLTEDENTIADAINTHDVYCIKEPSGKIIGFSISRQKNNIVTWISSIYIDPDQQSKGYGTMLLNFIEQKCIKIGNKVVALETHPKAHWAIDFYLKNSYAIVNDMIDQSPYNLILSKPPVPNRPIFAKLLSK